MTMASLVFLATVRLWLRVQVVLVGGCAVGIGFAGQGGVFSSRSGIAATQFPFLAAIHPG